MSSTVTHYAFNENFTKMLNNYLIELGSGLIEVATESTQKLGNAALRLSVQPLFVSVAHML